MSWKGLLGVARRLRRSTAADAGAPAPGPAPQRGSARAGRWLALALVALILPGGLALGAFFWWRRRRRPARRAT